MYADDTKIWRVIHNHNDQVILQDDIDKLYAWSVANKIKFNTNKCKVITVTLQRNPLLYTFRMNGVDLELVKSEKDLGVTITHKCKWNTHHSTILSKANQKLGLMKRTCSFSKNKLSRKILMLSVIRSQFEHASPVWRPTTSTQMNKFESLQKKCIKWVLNEDYWYYSRTEYLDKLQSLDILPMYLKFRMNDIIFFHKIVYGMSVVSLPDYVISARSANPDNIRYFQRQTRQFNDSDRLKYKSTVSPRIDAFSNSFFPRSTIQWNSLPYNQGRTSHVLFFGFSAI